MMEPRYTDPAAPIGVDWRANATSTLISAPSHAPATAPAARLPALRWGLPATLMAGPVIFGFAIVFTVASAFLVQALGAEFSVDGKLALSVTTLGLFGQQFAMGAYPVLVSKTAGNGPRLDLRLRTRGWTTDALRGIALGVAMAIAAGMVSTLVSFLVGIEAHEASNTGSLTQSLGGWVWPTLLLSVVGAPIVEELMFRGMLLRALEEKWGQAVAVIGSTAVFTLIHFNGGTVQETLVLFSAIGTIGAILAIAVVRSDRLLGAIFAHMTFNFLGALAAFDAFGT